MMFARTASTAVSAFTPKARMGTPLRCGAAGVGDQLAGGQMNGYGPLSTSGLMPKKSLSTDSAVQYAPSTHA